MLEIYSAHGLMMNYLPLFGNRSPNFFTPWQTGLKYDNNQALSSEHFDMTQNCWTLLQNKGNIQETKIILVSRIRNVPEINLCRLIT